MTSILPERDERTFTVQTSSKAYRLTSSVRSGMPFCDVCNAAATHRVMVHMPLRSGAKAIASLHLCEQHTADEGWS